jgi:hypothetical protein
MTRDDMRGGPLDERDLELGSALDELEVPDYRPGFLASVWGRIDEASRPAPADVRTAAAGGRRRSLWTRRRLLTGIAAAGVAAVAVVVALFGLPGVGDRTGPPPVSAATIVHIAQTRLGSTQTLVADYTVTLRMVTLAASPPVIHPVGPSTHYRLSLRSDGSYRQTLIDNVAPQDVVVAGTAYESDVAFDATTGTLTGYERAYDGMMPAGRRHRTWAGVETGFAPGPPDDASAPPTYLSDFGAFARALRAVGGGDVSEADYEGRPAWVVSCDVAAGPTERVVFGWGEPQQQADRLTVTVDKQTGLPVRMQQTLRGVVTQEYRLSNVRLNEALPAGSFTVTLPRDINVRRRDGHFRTVPLNHAAALAGRHVVLPATLPDGYRLAQVAARARTGSVDEMPLAGTKVISLHYQRGFDSLTVTTRHSARSVTPEYAIAVDPFMGFRWTGSVSGPTGVMLTSGAFAGVPARYVVAPLTVPHLWAMKDGVLLTISGDATADELVAMADSLSTYRGSEEAAP